MDESLTVFSGRLLPAGDQEVAAQYRTLARRAPYVPPGESNLTTRTSGWRRLPEIRCRRSCPASGEDPRDGDPHHPSLGYGLL